MRSLERRFNDLEKKRTAISSLLNFAGAITERNFSDGIIRRWFNQLVDREDYDKKDKRIILEFLFLLSSTEDDRKQG